MSDQLPETVKIAWAELSLDTSISGSPFPLHLGVNEVAILLSFYYHWRGGSGVGDNLASVGIWRKTDTDPTGIFIAHTDMIWTLSEGNRFIAESVWQSGKEHVILPWPLVLIRAPRLVGLREIFTSVTVDMRLFYIIQKVSDEELAKLMVKDHA